MSQDGTYFVGKTELLNWINSTLDLNLTKLEQTSSGAAACQLLDAIHPGSIALQKVDFNAVNDYDCINNYKVLQAAFNKLNITKPVDVHKLIKARPLDNIEFMQWFKKYFDDRTGGEVLNYDAAGRRAGSKTGDIRGLKVKRPANPSASAGTPSNIRPGSTGPTAGRRAAPSQPPPSRLSSRASTAPSESTEVAELAEQVTEMKLKVDGVERERDFYFDKLRDVELLCQMPELQSIPAIKLVERILYAMDDAESKQILMEAQREYQSEPGSNGHTDAGGP